MKTNFVFLCVLVWIVICPPTAIAQQTNIGVWQCYRDYTGGEFLQALDDSAWYIDDYAREMINTMPVCEEIRVGDAVMSSQLIMPLEIITVRELGFPNSASFDKICQAAKKRGLELCNPTLGPGVCLGLWSWIHKVDISKFDRIFLAMDPIKCGDGSCRIFGISPGDAFFRDNGGILAGSGDIKRCVFGFSDAFFFNQDRWY